MNSGLVCAAALVSCACVALPRSALERGAVVCEHPLAAEVGAQVLARGGNAADAAIATALALAVVLPQAGNLGGGGFALWCSAEGEALALDFRETAPASADAERLFDERGAPLSELLLWSPLGVGVPGTPAGLERLLARCGSGRFSLAELAGPAIELAERGFAVDAELAADLRVAEDRARLERSPAARARFYPGGEPLAAGALLVQQDLARTLRRFAEGGSQEFYGGETARALVGELERAALALPDGGRWDAGWVTHSDLESYTPLWREPLRGEFRGREVWTMPPPSSGGVILLQVAAVLERSGALRSAYDSAFAHALAEALRCAFAERAEVMGDPAFTDVPVERLLGPAWIERAAASIGERAALDSVPQLRAEGTDTTHLSVVDRAGNAVALTTTLNSSFGSGRMVEGAGFLLNNELDDFALGGGVRNQFGLVGGEANQLRPLARPLSSMTPTIVRADGRVELVLGSPGGPRIVSAVTQVFLRVLAFDEPLESALAAPRLHQQWSPRTTRFERGFPRECVDALRARGHDVEVSSGTFASVQAIGVDAAGRVVGVSDPRRGGAARYDRVPPRPRPGP